MSATIYCFHDETGEEDMSAGHYMVTMVMHSGNKQIDGLIEAYESRLKTSGLRDIPFHAVKLLHGYEGHEGISPQDRKRMLVAFATFVRTLPVTYHLFSYTGYDVRNQTQLARKLEDDVRTFLESNLVELQTYDHVEVFYDGGQHAVNAALRNAYDAVLSKGVVCHRTSSHKRKRLYQVADYLCSIELAAQRYQDGNVSSTYNKFYGTWRSFRENYLKQARKKRV